MYACGDFATRRRRWLYNTLRRKVLAKKLFTRKHKSIKRRSIAWRTFQTFGSTFSEVYCFLWRQISHRSCNFMFFSFQVHKQTFCSYFVETPCNSGLIGLLFVISFWIFSFAHLIIPYAVSSFLSTQIQTGVRPSSITSVIECMVI